MYTEAGILTTGHLPYKINRITRPPVMAALYTSFMIYNFHEDIPKGSATILSYNSDPFYKIIIFSPYIAALKQFI